MKIIKVIIIILIALTFSCSIDFSKKEIFDSNIADMVTKKYLDKWNHETPTIICIKNNIEYKYELSPWSKNTNLWEYVQIGDSIIKPFGSLNITIKKPNGTYKIFNYKR